MTEITFDNFSALGTTPFCDICGKPVKEGDRVKQSFVGAVFNYEDELVVKEEKYVLIHLDCKG